ncbi:MAG: hypothetical protein JOZ96_26255 [Acidobacteria bacterium]|nr:hypothetical protein [Acidobacteriota bacterium]
MNYPSRLFVGAAALLIAACVQGAQGQQMSAAERAARERMANDAAETEEREMALALLERYHRSGERRDPHLAFAQIREDFLRLQVVNNDLARATSGGGDLDLKLVAKSAAEIRKLAERLKLNLVLPEAAEDEKRPSPPALTDVAQLRTALSRLDGIVLRFANSLHAKGVRRLDADSYGRLRLDLEAIVSLSGRLKKGSEKLGEANR